MHWCVHRQHSRYAELAARHNNHLRALIQHQGEDGTWHQLVDDPTSFHELISTGLIGYAITRGLQVGTQPVSYTHLTLPTIYSV